MKHARFAAAAVLWATLWVPYALTFTAGSLYSTSDSAINQYGADRSLVASLASPRAWPTRGSSAVRQPAS